MEIDDDTSLADTPIDIIDDESLSEDDKARAYLQGWADLLPYQTESIEEMHRLLQDIVANICICAKAKNWHTQSQWDGKLQLWLRMHYPLPKATRCKLIQLYYSLCTLPGLDPQLTRGWADMVNSLLTHLNDKLKASDLQLPWQPLWRVLKKELFPKSRVHESTRNVVNILLFIAERCSLFYPASEVKNMLDVFAPLTTPETISYMIAIYTSFLPPYNCHLYVPLLFHIWRAFKLPSIDERLLEAAGELSERHTSVPKSGIDLETVPQWKDIGIWSQDEWVFLTSKSFDALHISGIDMLKGLRSGGKHDGPLVQRPKKVANQQLSLAKILVYSMAIDGEARDAEKLSSSSYVAGSKALTTLDEMITSKETYFHPSNPGTLPLTSFLFQLSVTFGKRWQEEQRPTCEVPIERRLTKGIRHAFVKILRVPALLSMFDKDPISMGYTQAAIRCLATLEPSLIMPELLDRAYSGLEAINETHRTTAVLGMMSTISRPLVSERLWIAGQKHAVALLESALPGIDLNDPTKTICSTTFVLSVVQFMKIGDLSGFQGESIPGDTMDVDEEVVPFPEGTEPEGPTLSREEERLLTRDSTASFADWITSLLRRIFALYENLPEEGGRRETTGGKSEEAVLKSIKNMMDVVCLHLSRPLFDLALKVVFEYAATNARANSVRAFGGLVACLARAYPRETLDKFLPHCAARIEEELNHGASSTRTTSSHQAVPSDTALHWNLAILLGVVGYGGPHLLRYKTELNKLMLLMIDKTKGERGYSSSGRIIGRILASLSNITPNSSRFVNDDEWDDPVFEKQHSLYWGKFYLAKDVKISWHVPSTEEIDYILEVLENIASPTLEKLEFLLSSSASWGHVERNDFCRYLYACRSIWSCLPTLCQETSKSVVNPLVDPEIEVEDLTVTPLNVNAGFLLTDPSDPRYQRAWAHKTRFGEMLRRAAELLTSGNSQAEDHTDAVLGLVRAIEIYLLEYGCTRGSYESAYKNYIHTRGATRIWPNEKESSRLALVKRVYAYHCSRNYMHALYRRRSALDDQLLGGLVELSLSPYTRVRRQAQSVLNKANNAFVRATAFTLQRVYESLKRGTDPDRMKGSLYILSHNATTAYAINRLDFFQRHLISLVECQHEEKPSVQKMVHDAANEATSRLQEELVHSEAYTLDTGLIQAVVDSIISEFLTTPLDSSLLGETQQKIRTRAAKRVQSVEATIEALLAVAQRPTTHWRYVAMACKFLAKLLRRDAPPPENVTEFFAKHVVSAQPNIRGSCQRALIKITYFVKIRTYSSNNEELWYHEWSNPLKTLLPVTDPQELLQNLSNPSAPLVDKLNTGYLSWPTHIKAYAHAPDSGRVFSWEQLSEPNLNILHQTIIHPDNLSALLTLWGQETSKTGKLELRNQNATFAKSLATTVLKQDDLLRVLDAIEPLIWDPDRYKQRAGTEFLGGILRGSKHWSTNMSNELVSWITVRLDRILAQINPDTITFWQDFFAGQLTNRDPHRNKWLIDYILKLPLDFTGSSAFAMGKNLSLFSILAETQGVRFNEQARPYVDLFFENLNTGYEEIRQQLALILHAVEGNLRRPGYISTDALLVACTHEADPLRVSVSPYLDRVKAVVDDLSRWRNERLPPPLTGQSQYDKVGLALLQWFYTTATSPQAPTAFPYFIAMMPEVLRMSELNDKSELQSVAGSYMFVIASNTTSPEYVQNILTIFIDWIHSSSSWRSRRISLPGMVVFFFRNLLAVSPIMVQKIMDLLLETMADENVEVREKAAQMLSGVIRVSQRQSIIPLKDRFVKTVRTTRLPRRNDAKFADTVRKLHAGILGLCALVDAFPYSVEPWVPSLITILADHSTDPPPISTSIRRCASDFKKTHQDTWSKDQLAFDEDSLQSLHTIIVGNSYYA